MNKKISQWFWFGLVVGVLFFSTGIAGGFKKEIEIANGHQIRVWTERGWIQVERQDAKKGLVWRIPLAQAKEDGKPVISEEKGAVTVTTADNRFYLRTNSYGIDFYFLRGVIQGPVEAYEVQFDPQSYRLRFESSYGGTSKVSRTLWSYDGWYYFALGAKLFPNVGAIFRMTHQGLDEGRIFPSSGVDRIFLAWDEQEIFYDGHFIFVRQLSDIAFDNRWKAVQTGLKTLEAPESSVERWFNCDTTFSLSSLSGKVVLVCFADNVFASMLKQLPQLDDLYRHYQSQGLRVVGVHRAEDREKSADFLLQHSLTFPIGLDTGKTAEAYQVAQWPAYFLIDRKGKIRRGNLMQVPGEKVIQVLLDEN